MAKGKIEQEIALKVTGLEDLESIDKKIAAREKKKSKLLLEVDTGDASKKIDKLDAELDALKARKAELTITANVEKALSSTKEVLDNVKKLDGDTATVVLGIKAAEIERVLAEVRTDLAQIDGQTVDVEVRAAEAKQLTDQLQSVTDEIKRVNGTPVEIDTTRATKGLGEVGKSADSSKSVLANMVGNATQDLGALGGVAGSAGVAIGQMGEYMADAKASGEGMGSVLRSFAGVAGPIAAISIGIGLVTKVIGDIQKKNEEIAKASKEIAKGITDDFQTMEDSLGKIDTGDFADRLRDNFIKTQDTVGRTLLAFDELGIGVDELGDKLIALDSGDAGRLTALEDIITTSGKFKGATEELTKGLAMAILTSEDVDSVWSSMRTTFGDTGAAFVDNNRKIIESLEQVDDAAEDISVDEVLKQTTDQLLNSAGGVEAFVQATNELGPAASKIDIVSRAIEILDQNTRVAAATEQVHQAQLEGVQGAFADAEERAKAAGEAEVEAAEEAAKAQAELLESIEATNEGLDEAAIAAEGFTSALDKIDAASELDFSLMAIDTVKSFDDIKGALEDAQKAGVNWSKVDLTPESVGELKGITPELQAVTEAVHGMRESIQTELTAAFDTGGIQGFRDKAAFFAEEISGQFTQSFKDAGASTAEAEAKTRELLEALGLLPEQVEITVKLSQAEAARKTLEIFKSDIDNLPPDVSTNIKTLWAKGDTIAALQALNAYLLAHDQTPIDIDSIINPPPAPPAIPEFPPVEISAVYATEADGLATMIDNSQQAVDGTPVEVPVGADITDAEHDFTNWIDVANRTTATPTLDADPKPADNELDGWVHAANAAKGRATLGANGAPAAGVIDGWEANANAARGTGTMGATATPANNVVDGWEAATNRTTATATANAKLGTYPSSNDIVRAIGPVTVNAVVKVAKDFFAAGGTATGGGIAGEAGAEFIREPGKPERLLTGPSWVPPGTRVTSARRTRSILARRRTGGLPLMASGGVAPAASTTLIVNHTTNVNAAVVGNRYDVAKAVGQGNRDLRRLVGARGAGVR